VRVILAEDHVAMCSFLARTLRRAGYEVVETHSGDEALEQLAVSLLQWPPVPFHLMVLDVRMPGYGGLDLLATLRHQGLQVPVIVITAFGDDATHAAAYRLGALAVLDKPFDPADLLAVARAALVVMKGAPGDGQADPGPKRL
jgi:DNA-binding response OmpR family regulator